MYTLPSPLILLQEAWEFYRKHSVFNWIAIWLLALPFWILTVLQSVSFNDVEPVTPPYPPLLSTDDPVTVLLFVLGALLMTVVTTWGTAAVLFVGKRMVSSPAGRTRSSFKAVRKASLHLILPLLFTMILRSCFIVLWSILLIIPGLIYVVRTALYQPVIVCEDRSYRKALRESKALTRGQFWSVLGALIVFVIALFGPASLFDLLNALAASRLDVRLLLLGDLISSVLFAYATMLFLLALTALYRALKRLPDPIPD
ncbi:MAG: hypothetical protein RIQ56_730 [Candidatus Parcubacteria bacterium]|jgi:uncharacterized membrane protein